MLTRIRRIPAMRLLPVWIALTSLNVSVVMGLVAMRAVDSESPVPAAALVTLGWLGVSAFLLLGNVRARASMFELTLPLPARGLWLSHMGGMLLAGTLIILGIVIVISAPLFLIPGHVELAIGPFALFALLFSGLCLAASLMASFERTLAEVAMSPANFVRTVLVLIGVFAALLLISVGHAAWTALPMLAALALGWSTYRSLPATFKIVPLEADSDETNAVPRGSQTSGQVLDSGDSLPASRWIVWTSVFRVVSAGWRDLLGLPLIALLGVFLGGIVGRVSPDPDVQFLRFLYIPMATYLLFAMVPPRMHRLHNIDFLPVSRRLVFALLVIPAFAAIWLGYGFGAHGGGLASGTREYVNFRGAIDSYRVSVPFRFMKIDWDGEPPPHVSPWGETHMPPHTEPIRGSGVVLYSPFSVTEESSKKFVALQISRAAHEVYGATISPDEIENRYLETRADGSVGAKGGRLPLRKDFTGLEPRRAGPLFPFMVAIVSLPWLLLLGALFRAHRAGLSNTARKTIYWGSLGFLLVLFFAQVVGMIAGLSKPWAVQALVELPVEWIGQSPPGTIFVWVLSGIVVLFGYLFAEAQFVRMEIPTRPMKYDLFDHLLPAKS